MLTKKTFQQKRKENKKIIEEPSMFPSFDLVPLEEVENEKFNQEFKQINNG